MFWNEIFTRLRQMSFTFDLPPELPPELAGSILVHLARLNFLIVLCECEAETTEEGSSGKQLSNNHATIINKIK